MAKSLIVGNWKTYVSSPKEARKLLKSIEKGLPRSLKSEVILCPPAPLLSLLSEGYAGTRILFGAQDVSYDDGAPTGDIMPDLLKAVGATYVIVGHAERRRDGDTNSIVGEKINAALVEGLRPIVCFGETIRDKEGLYLAELERDIIETFSGVSEAALKKIVIAYEPVWAIGAALPPSSREIQETNIFIRKTLASRYPRSLALKMRILYGGSVDDENAEELIQNADVSGFLLGRASVHPDVFTTIVKAWQ